jgi:hypothetical protein
VTTTKARKPRRGPGEQYWTATRPPTVGVFAKPLGTMSKRFYDGTPGRELVPCPDCNKPADAIFGDHGGSCIASVRVPTPASALGIVRAAALKLRRFSMNDLRAEFDRHGVSNPSRGSAFTTAAKRDWIEPDGSIPSLGERTKRHRIQTYRSLIHPEYLSEQAALRSREVAR